MRNAKLIDGELHFPPHKFPAGDYFIINPPVEKLLEAGYKPVTFTDPPETEPGYIAVPGWTETADEIVQIWSEEPEPDEISVERAYEIITGEGG